MKAFHARTTVSVALLALAACSSLRAGPGVDYWMRKHVFPAQAKAAAVSTATTEQAAAPEVVKTVEVTRIEHAYRGVPRQVVVKVAAPEVQGTSLVSSEKPADSTSSGRSSSSSSSAAVIH